jgi:parallel beta-helix repeat protein
MLISNLTYVVERGNILVVQPGTVVRFAHDARLIVEGQLLAEGTASELIKFTSYEPEFSEYDFWSGIEFLGADQDTSRIDYCIIENIDRKDGKGSIFLEYSIVNITNSLIHNNHADIGGGVYVNNSLLNLSRNKIENNSALYGGGAIYISNNIDDRYTFSFIYKNVIINNKVSSIGSPSDGGGGIFIDEVESYNSLVRIQENDIVSNSLYNIENGVSGSGGGILVRLKSKYSIELLGNKIMYNRSYFGAGITVLHKSESEIPPVIITNNIISNNTASDYSGGIYYNTASIFNPSAIVFENNDIVNNLNLSSKTGAGGFYVRYNSTLQNYFTVRNCILWNNSRAGVTHDAGAYPEINPAAFVEYCNSTEYIEGAGNISANSLYQRTVNYYGCEPYENYLRGDYHISLESPCVDAGDPKTISVEPDKTTVNIGAYGNTNEATTSQYETIVYTEPRNILVKAGETLKLDCRYSSKEIELNDVIVEDGGNIFIAPSYNTPLITINSLVTNGKKIGDLYTTRIQRMTTEGNSEFLFNIVNIANINCTGVEFNNMAVNVNSQNTSNLIDSRVYVYDYNENLTGVQVSSPDFDVTGNTVDNFGIGIYYHPQTKFGKATRGKIANNTISFDADIASKGESKAKGIKVEQCDAQITGNTINNPNEGIEASASSGKISNNTVSFDADIATKGSSIKRAVYLFGGAYYEVDHNKIICDDGTTPDVRAIDVADSYINAHYNIISFNAGYDPKLRRYGFYTYNLLDNSIFINNTIFNSNFGIMDSNTAYYIKLYNNIFYGPGETSISGNRTNLVLYNNDIVGTINWEAVKDEYGTIYENPQFQSSKINDYYLWKDSGCIDTGRYEPAYHSYNVNFYGTAPDIGAVEFYQQSSFYAPQNVSCTANSTTITLTWSAVPDAVSYNIYRSLNPYGTFEFVKNISDTYWSASTSGSSKYFYYVTALRDGIKLNSDSGDAHKDSPSNKLNKKNVKIIKSDNSNK